MPYLYLKEWHFSLIRAISAHSFPKAATRVPKEPSGVLEGIELLMIDDKDSRVFMDNRRESCVLVTHHEDS